jgi:predicted kinase
MHATEWLMLDDWKKKEERKAKAARKAARDAGNMTTALQGYYIARAQNADATVRVLRKVLKMFKDPRSGCANKAS